MSLPFVIEALLVARRARRDGAFERVRQCRVDVRDAEIARGPIAESLERTMRLRGECIARLSSMVADGAASALDCARTEDHIAMLGARADEIRIELSRVEREIATSRAKLDHSIQEFMRTQKRLDAVLQQKAQWESEFEKSELSRDEGVGIVRRSANPG